MVAGFSGQSPTLDLVVGCMYTFSINVNSEHPLLIVTSPTGAPPPAVTSGIVPAQNVDNGITTGSFVFTPTQPMTVYYYCLVHGFSGMIVVSTDGSTSGAVSAVPVLSLVLMLAVALVNYVCK